jgi:hypothetical protein
VEVVADLLLTSRIALADTHRIELALWEAAVFCPRMGQDLPRLIAPAQARLRTSIGFQDTLQQTGAIIVFQPLTCSDGLNHVIEDTSAVCRVAWLSLVLRAQIRDLAAEQSGLAQGVL